MLLGTRWLCALALVPAAGCLLDWSTPDAGRDDRAVVADAGPTDLLVVDVVGREGNALDLARADNAQVDRYVDSSVDLNVEMDAPAPDLSRPDVNGGEDASDHDAWRPDRVAAVDVGSTELGRSDSGRDAAVDPLGLVWVPIPGGGSFEMGCSPGDPDCDDDEFPRHTVTISAFEMLETEVTQEQYEEVAGSSPSYHEGCPTCPVEMVNWQEATTFCQLVGGRLPTEAEWEYAARAGTTTRYYCGDDVACLDGIAWYDSNSGDQSHPAGEKSANAFGLHDMLGNVWEWTSDWYSESYYSSSPAQDPQGPETGAYRVLRGGSFGYFDSYLRVSYRGRVNPGYSGSYFGFRCAR